MRLTNRGHNDDLIQLGPLQSQLLFHFVQFPVPDMTYNVSGGTLTLTQSINQSGQVETSI